MSLSERFAHLTKIQCYKVAGRNQRRRNQLISSNIKRSNIIQVKREIRQTENIRPVHRLLPSAGRPRFPNSRNRFKNAKPIQRQREAHSSSATKSRGGKLILLDIYFVSVI